jgi:hypothetical protein
VSWGRSAAAGVAAAWVWAAVEPLDTRIAGCDYSDVAMLGKAVTRSRLWPLAGLAVHGANGAVFGLALEAARRRTGADPRRLALGLAVAEHLTLFPLGLVVDRAHPARGSRGVAPMTTPRGFALESFRHVLFGAVLGRLAA